MYPDRWTAGTVLAKLLVKQNVSTPLVFAVPRGGIIVAAPIIKRLGAGLEILVTRKIGHPYNPEVAIGAVMPDGSAILDVALIEVLNIQAEYIEHAIDKELEELRRRIKLYSCSSKSLPVADKTVIIVDDGIATGYTMRAAITWLKTLHPKKIMVAVPVAPQDIIRMFAEIVDDIICPLQPLNFEAVGKYYEEFPQNTDEEVLSVLEKIDQDRVFADQQ